MAVRWGAAGSGPGCAYFEVEAPELAATLLPEPEEAPVAGDEAAGALGVDAGVAVLVDDPESVEALESLDPLDGLESPCDEVEPALILPWLEDRESLR
ncbi:MAG: hypothetical protein ACOH2F_04595 [Cellulomonas sp.]